MIAAFADAFAPAHPLTTAIVVIWVLFWIYWFAAATRSKRGTFSRRRVPLNGLTKRQDEGRFVRYDRSRRSATRR